MKQDISDNA